MIQRVSGATLAGIAPLIVTVEADLSRGLPKFDIVGLPNTSVREGRNRILSALAASGFRIGARRITVNLAPASVSKEGAALDLPIAAALLAGLGAVDARALADAVLLGELALDGSLRPTRGGLAVADHAARAGFRRLVLPRASAAPAAAVRGIRISAPTSLAELVAHLVRGDPLPPPPLEPPPPPADAGDFADVGGQEAAKRALTIAAAGEHNLLLAGPPGIGKSLLATRLPSILPPLPEESALEVARIRSAAGSDPAYPSDLPPFRAPHHHASLAGMIGGGRPFRPGEFTLAHRGVLFLDELPEFRRDVAEALREPLERGEVTVARSEALLRLPARFLLVGAMNLCPCGRLGDPAAACLCPPPAVARYHRRLSGPVRDRVDLWVMLSRPRLADVLRPSGGERSEGLRAKVKVARERQARRNGEGHWNGRLTPAELSARVPCCGENERLLARAVEKFGLSGRGVHKVLAVARTIADLEGEEGVTPAHVAEALGYRRPGERDL